jgi:hypothetical protein
MAGDPDLDDLMEDLEENGQWFLAERKAQAKKRTGMEVTPLDTPKGPELRFPPASSMNIAFRV